MKKIILFLIIGFAMYALFYFFQFAIFSFQQNKDPKYLTGHDIELYEHTKAWGLAKAVKKEHVNEIKATVVADTSLKNFQDHHIGMSLLNWAVCNRKYESAKVLLELGANPNMGSENVPSAFINAAGIDETSKYLKLLLKYGGDINAEFRKETETELYSKTPLTEAASGNNLENVKILVEAGARVDFFRDSVNYVLANPLDMGYMDILKFLIIECHANVKSAISYNIKNEPQHIPEYLRRLEFDLSSKDHKIKMEIVEYLKQQGIDYRKEPIPDNIAKRHDKEYLEKY